MSSHVTFSIIISLVTASIYSQIQFEKGYYVNNNGNRIECLIENRDWNNNPTSFSFKESDSSPQSIRTIEDVQEFAIYQASKYVRADVDIDRSNNKIGSITAEKNPVFVNQRLFLKVITEGKYDLFSYDESGINKFFYRSADNPIKQLVYLKYYPTIGQTSNARSQQDETDFSTVKENNAFRNQLWSDAKCNDTQLKDVEKLKYTLSSLKEYFKTINGCDADASASPLADQPFESKINKGDFNIKLSAAFNQFGLKIERNPSYLSTESSESGFSFGAEAEYILATNRNKWSLIAEPNYYKFETEQGIDTPSPNNEYLRVKFTCISVPVGIRHYMFLTDTQKVFFNGVFAVNMLSDSYMEYASAENSYVATSLYNFGIGAGYEFGRFSGEFRFYTPMGLNPVITSNFNRLSFTLRYKILK